MFDQWEAMPPLCGCRGHGRPGQRIYTWRILLLGRPGKTSFTCWVLCTALCVRRQRLVKERERGAGAYVCAVVFLILLVL